MENSYFCYMKITKVGDGAFLKLPLDLTAGLGRRLMRCPEEESIAQQIMLLIVSRRGEVIGKESYGSMIWDLEFHQTIKFKDWEEKVRESLMQAISEYEKRLKDVLVQVQLSEVDNDLTRKQPHLRRQATIHVSAVINATDQPFQFETTIYVSPLSQ